MQSLSEFIGYPVSPFKINVPAIGISSTRSRNCVLSLVREVYSLGLFPTNIAPFRLRFILFVFVRFSFGIMEGRTGLFKFPYQTRFTFLCRCDSEMNICVISSHLRDAVKFKLIYITIHDSLPCHVHR
jgi:hypothetical protein